MKDEKSAKKARVSDTGNRLFVYDAEKVDRLKKEVGVTDGLASFFKALADDTRLKIIHALSQEELCVCDVANILGSTAQAASHHLRLLRNVGLTKDRKEGKMVFYSLKDHKVSKLIEKVIADLKQE